MNKTIMRYFFKHLFEKKTKLVITTLTYYFLLAIIPVFLLVNYILESLHIYSFHLPFQNLSGTNISSNFIISISIISIYLITRLFYTFFQSKNGIKRPLLKSIFLATKTCALLSIYIVTFLINFHIIKWGLRIVLIAIILVCISNALNKKIIKYSLIFCLPFSFIINMFFYLFEIFSTSFITYENYYGLLAPLFVFILEINILIYIIYAYYLLSETYSTLSSIKIIKM